MLFSLIQFTVAAGTIVWAGSRLCRLGDRMAHAFQWSHHWVGLMLVAAATSLPELFTSVVGTTLIVRQPDLGFGNLVGSVLFNVLILAVFDIFARGRLIREGMGPQSSHPLLLVLLLLLLVFGGVVLPDGRGLFSMAFFPTLLIPVYCAGVWFISKNENKEENVIPDDAQPEEENAGTLSALLWKRFAVLTAVTFFACLWVSYTANLISEQAMLSKTFVGSVFLALVTSLPEVTVVYVAVRKAWYSLAVGAIFGSNAFNMVVFSLCDLVWPGSFLGEIGPASVTLILGALLMTVISCARFLFRFRLPIGFINAESVTVILVYFAVIRWLVIH